MNLFDRAVIATRVPRPPRHIPVGTYLTDGAKLVHVERQTHDVHGGPVVEVEDCSTLESSTWSVRSLLGAGFRPVSPA